MKKDILEILNINNNLNGSLRERSLEVSKKQILSDDIKALIKPMIDTMYTDDGIGLAAPQIGKNIRLIVIGKQADPEVLEEDLVLFNPTWERTSKKTAWDSEGCLSVPNVYGKVKRYKDIDVQALDINGEEIAFEISGYLARVIQHEVDHLDGVLFIDKAKDLHKFDPLTKKKHPYNI